MPTRASSPSSASSRIAGGTRRATSGRCTRSIRCASTGSTASRRCTASASSTSAAAAASSPTRWRGAAPTCSASTSPTKPLQGRAAARDRGGDAAHRVPRGRGRGARRRRCPSASTSSPAWRCSSTFPIPARSSPPAGGSLKPGGWAFFSTINRNAKAFVFAIVGAEHVLRLLPQGHARVREVPAPERARRLVPRRVARAGVDARPGIQPADAALSALGRHQRQLPRRLPQAGMTAARR